MDRRRLLRTFAWFPFMSGFAGGAAAQAQPKMRVRPGDPAWPSDAAWNELNRQVEGRLIKVRSPLPPVSAHRRTPLARKCSRNSKILTS